MRSEKYAVDRETLEKEVLVEFFIAGGPGGQHRNRRETGVRIVHLPSGLVIRAVERRSQAQNLEMAYLRLIRRLTGLNRIRKPRRNTRPSHSSVRRRLESKKQRSGKKKLRRPPREDE